MNSNELMAQVTSRAEMITPQAAAEYLSHNKQNRILRQNTVNRYAQEMLHGNWKLNGEGIQFDKEGNLVNGQHRLSAIIQAGIAVPMFVIRGVEDGSFQTYDCGKNRSKSDVFGIDGICNAHTVASIVSYYLALKAGRAASHSNRTFRKGGYRAECSYAELLKCYYEHDEIFQWAGRLAGRINCGARVFGKTMIGGLAVFFTIENKEAECYVDSFFDCFINPERRGKFTMFERLKDVFYNASAGKSGRLTDEMKLHYIARVWNAYKEGKNLSNTAIRYDETTKKSWFV